MSEETKSGSETAAEANDPEALKMHLKAAHEQIQQLSQTNQALTITIRILSKLVA